MTNLREVLEGAVVMAPMTKGGNLPYRRLCQELGADVTMSEMVVAHNLVKGSKSEYALIKRAPDERRFAVQVAGSREDSLVEAVKVIEQRGASWIDLNCGCPIESMTRKGLGSSLLQRPTKLGRLVAAMKAAVSIPVTVKIRLGYDDDALNYMTVAKAAVEGGADAIGVHGRTRTQRYRKLASWEAVGEVAAAVPVPVIGNGDILFARDILRGREIAKCAAVMIARGALIKPWIFREAKTGIDEDPTAEERLAHYRRYVELGFEHFGSDERGRKRLRGFLEWHLQWWCRHVPRRPDGSYPAMQEREEHFAPRSEWEAFLWRNDPAAHQWLATYLIDGEAVAGPMPPLPEAGAGEREVMPEG